MNFKNIFLGLIAVVMFSCQDNTSDILTPQELYDIDKSNMDLFIADTYYDESIKMFKVIDNNQTPLKDDANLSAVTYNRNGIDYTAYVYKINEGKNIAPDDNDIVNVDFEYFDFRVNTEGEFNQFTFGDADQESIYFRNLATENNIYTAALPLFKSGDVVESLNGPRTYSDSGEGLLLVPSGLEPFLIDRSLYSQVLIIKIKLRSVTPVENIE